MSPAEIAAGIALLVIAGLFACWAIWQPYAEYRRRCNEVFDAVMKDAEAIAAWRRLKEQDNA